MARIELLSFDLDNTLWDVTSVIVAAERTMRAWIGEQVPEFNDRFQGEAMAELRARAVAAEPRLMHDVSELRKAVLQLAFEALGMSGGEAKRTAQSAFEVFFEARQQVVLFDGALDVLETLTERYRLGALTNGNADIERIGLDRYFSFAISAADVGVSKPAPDMFHAALEHCRIEAAQAVHIGDHLVDDIEGAGRLGMHTIWTNHAGKIAPEDAHPPTATVGHLRELPAAIATLSEG